MSQAGVGASLKTDVCGMARRDFRAGDSDAPVLKNLVDRILRQRSDVMGFHSAPPTQGGTGAVLVLLAHR